MDGREDFAFQRGKLFLVSFSMTGHPIREYDARCTEEDAIDEFAN
jgi:hypothetical protein